MTLIEFLRARLDEDQEAIAAGPEPDSWCDRADGIHHEAARARAEVDAKRRMLGWHTPEDPAPEDRVCRTCWTTRSDIIECEAPDPWPCATIRALALPYADHPDYRDEWRA